MPNYIKTTLRTSINP